METLAPRSKHFRPAIAASTVCAPGLGVWKVLLAAAALQLVSRNGVSFVMPGVVEEGVL
jgi:hypothetical protein